MYDKLRIILGPTASGKTALAVAYAKAIDAEIVSADSRQVYKGMNVGTGKDLQEYEKIPYHLINVCEAGEKYHLGRFQVDAEKCIEDIWSRGKQVILCGGTGLYIQGLVEGFQYSQLGQRTKQNDEQEIGQLLPNDTHKRQIRNEQLSRVEGIKDLPAKVQKFDPIVFGLNPELEQRRARISERLHLRIEQQGLVAEVEGLLKQGLSHEMLQYYGLEYKYISKYLLGELALTDMTAKLETEIHRYAKRQMTFFRSLEKKGWLIHWIPNELNLRQKVELLGTLN